MKTRPVWWQEDHLAAEQACRLRQELRLGIPVDLASVLRRLDLRLDAAPAPDGVRACLLEECRVIRVNSRLHAWQQRFAIAHEVGHALVNRGALPVRAHRLERVCQLFAAHLLMPPEQLRPLAAAYYGRADLVALLMVHCHVSREAVNIQLRRLRLLPGEPRPEETLEESLALQRLLAADLDAHSPHRVPLLTVNIDRIGSLGTEPIFTP